MHNVCYRCQVNFQPKYTVHTNVAGGELKSFFSTYFIIITWWAFRLLGYKFQYLFIT